MIDLKYMKTLAAAGLLALFAGGVNAASVITVDDTVPENGAIQGTVTCVASCQGYVGSGAWSATNAIMFTIQPNSLADEIAAVNNITGESYVTASKTEDGGENYTFFSSALYILFKIGGQDPSHFLIKNTEAGMITINWLAGDDRGTGLSHYTEFGTAPVPVPAAGFLLLGALGGLALMRRRRQR